MIELSNTEIYEHCLLNIKTAEKQIINVSAPYFTATYYKNENVFLAIYFSKNGPIMYYEGQEYSLKKNLDIYLYE